MGDRKRERGDAGELPYDLSREVLASLLEGVQVISPDFRYLYVNDAVVRQGQTTKEALLGRTMMECYPGIDATEMFSVLRRCMAEHSPQYLENEFTFPDGSKGWFELRMEPGQHGVTILSVDITERKRAELALQRSMRALHVLSECNRTLVRAKDEQSFLDDICRLVVRSAGYRAAEIVVTQPKPSEPPVQARAGDKFKTSTTPSISIPIDGGQEARGTFTLHADSPDSFDEDERRLLEEVALDLGYGIHTLRARVSHANTQEQLLASHRLEAVGRLAGGVAHDFNNLLSVILTYARFAADQLRSGDPARDDIEQIYQAGERAAALTKQLLAFSRKQILEPQVTNLNTVVADIESMLGRLLGEDIEMRVQPQPALGNVLADPGQLEQVVMNLAINARDAMPRGGRLTIETGNVELDDEYAARHVGVTPGKYVRLSVADNGLGMTEETRARIFEPFFTTKDQSKGTGLGLSMVYGIVKQSGGNIWVYSVPGRGTTFKIYLPRVDAPEEERSPIQPSINAPATELILLVEDEEAVRGAAERILRSAGYRVLSAANGGEALLLSEKHPGKIDLLLTDVLMPQMSGPDLATRLKASNPELKVLFTSGYADSAVVHHGVLEAGMRFLAKPFSVSELRRKVREALDGH